MSAAAEISEKMGPIIDEFFFTYYAKAEVLAWIYWKVFATPDIDVATFTSWLLTIGELTRDEKVDGKPLLTRIESVFSKEALVPYPILIIDSDSRLFPGQRDYFLRYATRCAIASTDVSVEHVAYPPQDVNQWAHILSRYTSVLLHDVDLQDLQQLTDVVRANSVLAEKMVVVKTSAAISPPLTHAYNQLEQLNILVTRKPYSLSEVAPRFFPRQQN